MAQDEELESFVTGPAGSGKTTDLALTIDALVRMGIVFQVVAYTHKAKDVLISKLPVDTPISTLHSWLKKRPGVNEKAKHIRNLVTSKQYGKPEHLQLLIVDEFSFVGEDDYYSIGELQDELQLEAAMEIQVLSCSECGWYSKDPKEFVAQCPKCEKLSIEFMDYLPEGTKIPKPLKVLYIGDLNQLSPIDGPPAVSPHGKFWKKLTTIYRQSDATLAEPLKKLVDMMEGNEEIGYIEGTDSFIREADIDILYGANKSESKIMMAWTNQSVQGHNAAIQGRTFPQSGDLCYNYTMKEELDWVCTRNLEEDMILHTPNGKITKDTKFNPFAELRKNKDITYVQTPLGLIVPCIFGVYANKLVRTDVGRKLTEANNKGLGEKVRKNAYKAYKVLNDYVSVVDFPHCQTIHKSQGQEFDYVYIDGSDLASNKNLDDRLKLLYVAMSRAKKKIYINN